MKLATLFALVFSFSVFAATEYQISSYSCDGQSVPPQTDPSVKEFSYILGLENQTEGYFKLDAIIDNQGYEVTVAMQKGFTFVEAAPGRSTMTERGAFICSISVLGQSEDCSDQPEALALPSEEFVFASTAQEATMTFPNYVADGVSCNELVWTFKAI